MEFHSSHPLDNITRNNPYSMLEALIPFVDYSMKLPLALLVKYYEIRLIFDAFQSKDTLFRYGLHSSSGDPMDMLANIIGVSPEMIKTLMSMMESQSNTDLYNVQGNQSSYRNTDNYTENTRSDDISPGKDTTGSYINNFDNNTEYNFDDKTGYNFDDNIGNIFAEYDMLQAAEYTDAPPAMNSYAAKEHEYHANYSEPLQSTEYNSRTDNISENCQYNPEPEYYI